MQFEERAVAFIDVLGFKLLVDAAVIDKQRLEELGKLIDLLSSAIPIFNKSVHESVPRHLIPKHLYISDCIILSAPLNDEARRDYSGVEVLVMRAIQLQHFFMSKGYLLRGGVAAGKVFHSESNIVGPAYQKALETEQRARNPYVLLDDSCIPHLHGGSRAVLKDPKEDRLFVNGLFDYYIPNNFEHGAVERAYEEYGAIVRHVLASNTCERAKEKWQWFSNFLESESPQGKKWYAA